MYTSQKPTSKAVLPLNTIGITHTLELRWFRRGSIPVEVLHWFETNCPGQQTQTQKHLDRYLYTPGCDTISLKLRQGNIELKHYQGPLAMPQYGRNNSPLVDFWEGQSEQWIKWSYPIQPPFNNSEEVDILQSQPWIEVQKKRWQRHHQGIDIELTHVTVESEPWWSIALEATPQTNDPDLWFSRMISDISQTYCGPALLANHCYAYPAWLAKNFADQYPASAPYHFCTPLTTPYSVETYYPEFRNN